MAIKTNVELKTQIDAGIKVNGNREITPAIHNSIETNIIDSFLNIKDGGLVVQVLAGYSSVLTPSDNKHFTPKKYVDDLVSANTYDDTPVFYKDGSRSMTDNVTFANVGDGIVWSDGSSIKNNLFGGIDVVSISSDINLTSGGGIVLSSAVGSGITFDSDQDVNINCASSNINLYAPTGKVSVSTLVTDPSTLAYIDASGFLVSLANAPGVLANDGFGNFSWSAGGGVTSVSGTSNRITSTGGSTPVIDISASYVGQASITTLGTVTTGTWNGSVVTGQYGGTGVANTGKTITLGGNLTTTGAFNLTIAVPQSTTYTLPNTSSETLAGLGTAQTFTASQTIGGASSVVLNFHNNGSTPVALFSSTVSNSITFAGGFTSLSIVPQTVTWATGTMITVAGATKIQSNSGNTTTIEIARSASLTATGTAYGQLKLSGTYAVTASGAGSYKAVEAAITINTSSGSDQTITLFDANPTISAITASNTLYGFRSQIASGTGTRWNIYADGTAPNKFGGPVEFPSYTVAGVPSASSAGRLVYVSDESGGAVMAFSDGTNWRRVTDRAIIS
jgi:hypothetical protein